MESMTLKLVAESSVESGKWIIAGARMSRIRKSKGLSRGKAAKMLDVHPLELAMMELGYIKPVPEMYEYLFKAFE